MNSTNVTQRHGDTKKLVVEAKTEKLCTLKIIALLASVQKYSTRID